MAIRMGSWGLPEFGITEAIGGLLGSGRTAQGGSDIIPNSKASSGQVLGGYSAAPKQSFAQTTYTPPQTKQINYPSNSGGGSPVSSGGSSPSFDFSGGIQQPNAEIDQINNEFNAFNSFLNDQESQASANFNETKGLYDTQKAKAENQYKTEKTAQTESAQKQGALDLQKVRQLLSDLNQKNAAIIGITGGGSVSEALGERFGRQAQVGLGNVIDATQKSIQRVNDFYNNAITKLQDTYDANIIQAKQTLQENLNNIRSARLQSAAAKQQNSLAAWKDYYDRVNNAKLQAAQFKAQYDMWKQQQDSALAATQGFNLSNQGQYNNQVAQTEITSPGVTNPEDATSQNTLFLPQQDQQDEYLKKLGLLPSQ